MTSHFNLEACLLWVGLVAGSALAMIFARTAAVFLWRSFCVVTVLFTLVLGLLLGGPLGFVVAAGVVIYIFALLRRAATVPAELQRALGEIDADEAEARRELLELDAQLKTAPRDSRGPFGEN